MLHFLVFAVGLAAGILIAGRITDKNESEEYNWGYREGKNEYAGEIFRLNRKMRSLIKIIEEDGGAIDNTACLHCPRRKNGKPPEDCENTCSMTEDEAIELFIKYGLEDKNGKNHGSNKEAHGQDKA